MPEMHRTLIWGALALALVVPGARADEPAVAPPSEAGDAPALGSFYILVDKAANELTLRSLMDNAVLKKFRAISGLNSGDKVSEGDRKTPEGVYFTDGIIPHAQLVPSLHGPAGIGLNYPNPVDQINEQTGSGIWIHGVESSARLDKRFDTRGCVAVDNPIISELQNWISPRHTAVVIVDKETPMNPVGLMPPDSALHKRVQDWARAWSSRDPEAYIAFYHSDFRALGMNYDAWRVYKARLTKQYSFIDIQVNKLRVFRHNKYTVATFEQVYKSNRFQAVGWKRLYWVGPDEEAKILSEESLETRQGAIGSFPLAAE
jgi:murein L,D-transpeptidase YafK